MVNKAFIAVGVTALLTVILLNVTPLLLKSSHSVYIEQDRISGMAIVVRGLPYTLNFDQQKRSIDILNRAMPIADFQSADNQVPVFSSMIIYQFENDPIVIRPIAWKDDNLVFSAPLWSEGPLMEVSKRELYDILDAAYDKDLPQTTSH